MRSPEGESGPAREATERPARAPDEGPAASEPGEGAGGAEAPPTPQHPDDPSRPQYAPPQYPAGSYPGQPYPAGPYSGAGRPPGSYPGPQYAPPRYPAGSYPGQQHPAGPYPGAGPPPGPYPGQQYPAGPYPVAGYPPGTYGAPPYPGRPGAYDPPAGLGGGDGGPPERPRRTHRWGLGAFLLAEAVFLGVSLLTSLLLAGPDAGVVALGVAVAVPTVAAAAVAVLVTRLRGNGPQADLGLVWSWRDAGLGLAFGFGGLVVALVAVAVFVSFVGPDVTSAVGDLLGGQRADPAAALLIALIVVLVAPLCEEILYRGLLWGALEKLGAGRWIAFGVTTLAFALLHFEFTRAPLLLVISIPIGLARLYTGRLLASIVAHQVNNLLPGIALYLMLTGALPV